MNIVHIISNYVDLRSEILAYLSDYQINNLLSCNHTLYKIKKYVRFTKPILLNDKIYKLSYYDSFTRQG